MQTVLLPSEHALPNVDVFTQYLPRPLARSAAELFGPSAIESGTVAIAFQSIETARRASELLAQLAATIPFKVELTPKVARFDADGAHLVRATNGHGKAVHFTVVHSAEEPVSAEEQDWFREWLARRELAAGFAVVAALEPGEVGRRLIEEAKLVAAVYHGAYKEFGAAESKESARRPGQACCAW
jgi:hypothetical protein